MVKLKMLVTQDASPNGTMTVTYYKGSVHELVDSLAEIFLSNRWAEVHVPEAKAIPMAPENKSIPVEIKEEPKEEPKPFLKRKKK